MPLSSINPRSNNGGSRASDFSFFFQDPAKRKESQSGMIEMLRKSPLVLSLFAASLIPFQPADAQEAVAAHEAISAHEASPTQEENPAGNVASQAESTSTSEGADMNLL